MTRRIAFLAASAVLLLSTPAFAGNDRDDNSCKGNCPTTGGGPTTINNSPSVTSAPTFNNNPSNTFAPINAPVTTIAPKIEANGGTASLGIGNKFGGDGGLGIAGAAADANAAAVSAAKSASTAASTLNGTVTGAVNGTISPTISAPTTVAPNQIVNVDGDNYERAPVSSAFAIGSAGVGEGMCRFGPGIGAQGITAGYNFSLPIFPDKLCKSIAKDSALIRKAALLAQIAGNEAAVQFIAAKDAEVSKAITCARNPAACTAK